MIKEVTEAPSGTNNTETDPKKPRDEISTINVVTVFGDKMTSSKVQATVSALIAVIVVLGIIVLCLCVLLYKNFRLSRRALGLRVPQVSPH